MQNFSEKTLGMIEKARTKPEHVRHMLAFAISGGATLILVLVWAFVLLPQNFNKIAEENTNEVKNSPFAVFKAQVGSAYRGFMGSISEQKENLDWQNQYEKIKSEAQEN